MHLVQKRSTLLLLGGTALLSAFFVYFPLTNSDIFWHLASGREIVARKAFLFTDPFSYTPRAGRWIDLHWLFQVVSFGIFEAAGYTGLVAAKCAAVASGVVVLVLALRSQSARILTSGLIVVFLFEARYLVLARPIVITLLSLSAFLFFLERHRLTGKKMHLLALIAVQIIWTNAQGLFALGIVVAGCYWAESVFEHVQSKGSGTAKNRYRIRDLSVFGVLLLLSAFINPYRWRGVLFPLTLLGRIEPSTANLFSENISENVPLFSLFSTEPRMVMAVVFAMVLGVLSFGMTAKRVRIAHLLLFLGFGYLAVSAKRNVLLFFWISAPVIGSNLNVAYGRMRQGQLRSWAKKGALAGIGMLLFMGIFSQIGIVARYPKKQALSPFRYPGTAVEYLANNPVQGRMFNTDRFGGYLLWKMYPPKKVFIDGRFVLRSASFFQQYLDILGHPEMHFEKAAERWGITHAVIQTAIFPLYFPIADYLYHSENWVLVHATGTTAVFVRSSLDRPSVDLGRSEVVDRIAARLFQTWKKDPWIRAESMVHLSNFLYRLGHREQAQRVLRSSGLVSNSPQKSL